MPKGLLKIVGIVLIISTISEGEKAKYQQSAVALAKRSLLEREKEYIKTQPMSEDLREFIDRYKRKNTDKRRKRSETDNFYIIQNGQLVPVKTVKTSKRNDLEDVNNDVDSFTVVPLVIPLVAKPKGKKLVKIRTLTDEAESIPLNAEPSVAPAVASQSTSVPKVDNEVPKVGNEVSKSSFPPEYSEENNTSEEKADQEETQVLHKILEDVEGLMQSRHEGKKKEGVICNLNGSWISEAAGMRFDICYQNATRKKFRIHVADRIPPNEEGFLCDGNWTLFGELPFFHSGLVIVLAVHSKDKHIATFIGECKVCEGSEMVTGTWLIGRTSRDCKDQKATHKILSDVWKREQAHILRKKHLQQLGINTNNEDD